MTKEVRPSHEEVVCDVCERTMLKGERAEPYLAPGGQRKLVCELCADRAFAEGWIRESAHEETPTGGPRAHERRGILARLRRRGVERAAFAADGAARVEPEAEPAPVAAPEPDPPPLSRPKDPRHVRAVPTNAQAKVERAIEVFNTSEHPRTIAGIARSLGDPWVSATPAAAAPSEVAVVVAWELSWYHYRVDLGDENEPVQLVAKGEELDELEDWARAWNASAAADGKVALGVGSRP